MEEDDGEVVLNMKNFETERVKTFKHIFITHI